MEVETREVENGTEITVKADEYVALSVISNGKERIYLPREFSSNSTYYTEESTVETKSTGFSVVHTDSVDRINVIKS